MRTQKREAGKICKAIKLGVVGDGTVGKTTYDSPPRLCVRAYCCKWRHRLFGVLERLVADVAGALQHADGLHPPRVLGRVHADRVRQLLCD